MIIRRFAGVSIACTAALTLVSVSAFAQTNPGVSVIGRYNGGDKLRVMVEATRGANSDSVSAILSRDLDFSDRFIMVPSPTGPVASGPLNYALYTQLGVNVLLQASVSPTGAVHVDMHNVDAKVAEQKGDFTLPSAALGKDWRMAMHGVSDAVEEWMTGQKGIAQTRIAYVRDSRVWIVDSDGANPTAVTPRGMSPNWAPNGRQLVYAVLDADMSPIMVTDLATGAQRTLTNNRATQYQDYGPVVTPDGRSVVFTRSGPNGAEVYMMPLSGGSAQRLTSTNGQDSGQPTVSPDGRKFAFASTRTGNNAVYVADIDGTDVQRLSPGGFGEKTHNTPDWSPDGKSVAYTSGIGGSQQIMVVDVRSGSARQITDVSRNDDPSWAPDSRHVVFTSLRGGTQQIWVADTQSGRARQLTRGSGARLSAWSPRLSGTP